MVHNFHDFPANQSDQSLLFCFSCHVIWRSVSRVWVYSLRYQKKKKAAFFSPHWNSWPLEQRELRSMLLTQIDFVTSPFPPPPPGHRALCHQGHWANGSEFDTGNTQRISSQIPSGGPYDTFTFIRIHMNMQSFEWRGHAWVISHSRSLLLFCLFFQAMSTFSDTYNLDTFQKFLVHTGM